MPIFEYSCQNCSSEFEQLVSGTSPSVACPRCGSADVKKKFSVFGMSGVEKQVSSGAGCNTCKASSCSSCH